jgi:hypothetical protein
LVFKAFLSLERDFCIMYAKHTHRKRKGKKP